MKRGLLQLWNRGLSREELSETAPASTPSSFSDFRNKKVELKLQSQKGYICSDILLIFQPLSFFFILIQLVTSVYPKQLCGAVRAVGATRFHIFWEVQNIFKTLLCFHCFIPNWPHQSEQSQWKICTWRSWWTSRTRDRRRLFDFYFNSCFHDYEKTWRWESRFPHQLVASVTSQEEIAAEERVIQTYLSTKISTARMWVFSSQKSLMLHFTC